MRRAGQIMPRSKSTRERSNRAWLDEVKCNPRGAFIIKHYYICIVVAVATCIYLQIGMRAGSGRARPLFPHFGISISILGISQRGGPSKEHYLWTEPESFRAISDGFSFVFRCLHTHAHTHVCIFCTVQNVYIIWERLSQKTGHFV